MSHHYVPGGCSPDALGRSGSRHRLAPAQERIISERDRGWPGLPGLMVALRSGRFRTGQRSHLAEPLTDVAVARHRALRSSEEPSGRSVPSWRFEPIPPVRSSRASCCFGDYGAAGLAVTLRIRVDDPGRFHFGPQRSFRPRLHPSAGRRPPAGRPSGRGRLDRVGRADRLPGALALGEPQVAPLLIAGGVPLPRRCGSASNAFLTRSISFGVIPGATVTATVLAMICAVGAAYLGAGAGPCAPAGRPGGHHGRLLHRGRTLAAFLWFSKTAFRSLGRFAMPLTGAAVLFALQALVTGLLVGYLVGIDALGVWNFSMAMVVLPAVCCRPARAGDICGVRADARRLERWRRCG